MATTNRHTPWARGEMDALEMLYRAGWRWPAITTHINGFYGNERSVESVKAKGKRLGITRGRPKGHTPVDIADDLEDMLLLGYASRRMAAELGVSQCTVLRHLRQNFSHQRINAWRKGAMERQSESQRNRWAIRRATK